MKVPWSITSPLLVLLVLRTSAAPVSNNNKGRTLGPRSDYGRLIVFGDSFSDTGDGSWVVSNHTWPADPAYYNRSFSSNPLVQGLTGPNSTIPVPSASDQLASFLSTSSTPILPTDLFVHYIGANDPIFNPNITGAQIASLINADVDTLYRAGAKHILLATYPPISLFPALYPDPLYQKIGPPYSSTLTTGLRAIAAGWSPYLASIRVVDVGALLSDIVAHPESYGVDAAYVDPPTACLQGTYGSGSRSLCADPERHLFFDAYHPVGAVHDRIAKLFLQTLGAA